MEERRNLAPGAVSGASVPPGPPAGGPPASDVIGSALHQILQLSRAFERQVGQALEVNTTDLTAMEHLIQEGALTPGELSRRLDISTAATTLVIDRLVALGHAQRHPHASDRRKVVVVPAQESVTRAFQQLHPVIGGVAALTQELSDDERHVVEAFLERVIGVYRSSLDSQSSSFHS
ncbi:MarR family winged helix-turn-helix transcriptional regulator [Cryobacterium arcticum]|uniref:MarR family transcriptional regulator n=1 Tax=Cryobacterium arcticum TaxID=670052 RepID=A0A1B1BGL6_9MICO|nr:MarR family transcriptional regulator [Cryobacterium arcticum]ANP71702.1 MarR family transcriptional regulator [Cryobacterium arcticum]